MIELITPLNGILFVIATVVFSIEIVTRAGSNTNTVRQLIIYKNLKPQITKLLRPNWKIVNIAWFTCNKGKFGDYDVYVEVQNKKTKQWTNDSVITNKQGVILKERLSDNMEYYNSW
jgi:hypothetical protein